MFGNSGATRVMVVVAPFLASELGCVTPNCYQEQNWQLEQCSGDEVVADATSTESTTSETESTTSETESTSSETESTETETSTSDTDTSSQTETGSESGELDCIDTPCTVYFEGEEYEWKANNGGNLTMVAVDKVLGARNIPIVGVHTYIPGPDPDFAFHIDWEETDDKVVFHFDVETSSSNDETRLGATVGLLVFEPEAQVVTTDRLDPINMMGYMGAPASLSLGAGIHHYAVPISYQPMDSPVQGYAIGAPSAATAIATTNGAANSTLGVYGLSFDAETTAIAKYDDECGDNDILGPFPAGSQVLVSVRVYDDMKSPDLGWEILCDEAVDPMMCTVHLDNAKGTDKIQVYTMAVPK